jgi:hypothetical protein
MQILAYARLCVDGTVAATGLWQRALQWELSTGREGHLPGCIGWRDGLGDSAARIEAPMELRQLNTDDRTWPMALERRHEEAGADMSGPDDEGCALRLRPDVAARESQVD